jgi:segregation and condensation protein B
MTDLSRTIEALLFHLAEPVRVPELVRLLKSDRVSVDAAIAQLRSSLSERGIRLMEHADEVTLVTAPEASPVIESVVKEELSKDLSRAALETLSIVLYKGPLTRAEIDHIRGVNSTFILRTLMIRGLVEKIDNPSDQRSFLYRSTSDTLRFLGITHPEDLPGYRETQEKIAAILAMREEEKKQEPTPTYEPSVTQTIQEFGIIPEPDELETEMENAAVGPELEELETENYKPPEERYAP